MRISDWSSDVCSSDLQELARLQQPAARAQGYALEQISAHLDKAVQTVVGQKKVSLLLRPEAAFFAQPTVDITPAITTELDRVVPSVSISPPANWQPGQQQQQQRSEEHTSELQSLMRISYAVFCLKNKTKHII